MVIDRGGSGPARKSFEEKGRKAATAAGKRGKRMYAPTQKYDRKAGGEKKKGRASKIGLSAARERSSIQEEGAGENERWGPDQENKDRKAVCGGERKESRNKCLRGGWRSEINKRVVRCEMNKGPKKANQMQGAITQNAGQRPRTN